jgi:cytochrome c553
VPPKTACQTSSAWVKRSIRRECRKQTSSLASCANGPSAEGVRDIPRLGGLDYSYLRRRLEQWNQGYHAAAGPPMISIASKLADDQIEALASYLSFLK